MTHESKGMFALTAIVIAILAVWVWNATGGNIPGTEALVNDIWSTRPQSLFQPIDEKVYHSCPDHMVKNPQLTRHRYPLFPGNNITLLIHRGFHPLMEKAAQNPQWYDNSPMEMGGYSL